MDIKTLEALGVSPAELSDRIVDQAVQSLLYSTGFDEDGDESSYASKFKQQVEKRVQEAVDAKIAALAAEHVLPRVGEMIESANMRKTSQYGEPKGEPMTFLEYIASRAEVYMSEDVDYHGQSKEESKDSYSWRKSGQRMTVLMKLYIQDTLEKHAKSAISDVNKVIAKNIEQAARDAITAAASAVKVSVSV